MSSKHTDNDTDERNRIWEITGTVTGRSGHPIHGARVVVSWQQIRKRKELAVEHTFEDGRYKLKYAIPKNAPQPVLIVVEAVSEHLDKPLLSPVTLAKPTLEINLAIEPLDQSEWATLLHSIEPLARGLKLSELVENATHQDISFLASELNKNTEVIMRVAISARLETAFKIPAPIFYAFLRQRVPSSLPSPLLDASDSFTLIDPLVHRIGSLIFSLSAEIQTQTITKAIALDIIGPQFTNQIKQIVSELQALRTTDLLNQPFLVGNASLASLLDVAVLPPPKQQLFAKALATNSQSMRDFWQSLGDGNHGFTAEETSSIQRTLSIGAFVKNHIPLIKTVVQGFADGTYKALSDLAKLSLADWESMVNQTGPPPNIDSAGAANSAQVFANVVYTRVTRTYPTVALSSRILTTNLVKPAEQKPLIKFFQNNSSLELLRDNIAAHIANQGAKAFLGINKEDQPAVIANAKSFQRALRISADPDVAQTLLGLGIDSATKIAIMGQQQFFNKSIAAGLTKPQANQVFEVSVQRYGLVVSKYMQLNTDSIGVWPQAMGDLSNLEQPKQQALQQDSTLKTLFGSQDYCATDNCTSLLSPAAYLCDILLWLRNHQQPVGTALDVLDSRRPDIRHLYLNCPNTDTELPYIDLVNELLADKISPPANTTLASDISPADTTITVASNTVFPSPNFYVCINSEILLVSAVSGPGNTIWTVQRGQQGTTAASALNGAAVILTSSRNPAWKQTFDGLTEAQLRAAPAYFNQQAYVQLSNASYPQTLPYSAGLDGLRTYLQYWNLPLWQLRQALLPVGGGTTAQQADVAAERLGMNNHAENLVTSSNAVSLSVAWNTPTPTTDLVGVPAFLKAANITYESLLELLESIWVQGVQGITLQGINDMCETCSQTLSQNPLDQGFLDRANRFLRLWLATGYKMWELDLLLRAPSVGNGALNQLTLVALQDFWQLQKETGLAVDRLIAFYQDIDTSKHRDPDGTRTIPLYSQIFLNPTVSSIAPDPDLANLLQGVPIHDKKLDDHMASIQAALGISGADATTLIGLTDNNLTLDNLSLIYRVNVLAVTSRFSVSDLLKVVGLLYPAAKPMDALTSKIFDSPRDTLYFLNKARNVQQSGFSLGVLAYLLAPPFTINPSNSIVSTTLAADIDEKTTTITVANPSTLLVPFYIQIGWEILRVTNVGTGNTTWTVERGKGGTNPASAKKDDAVSGAIDPITLISVGWESNEIAPSEIASTLTVIQKTISNMLSVRTTLASGIDEKATTITVASGVGFPSPNFYAYINSEIVLVSAVAGSDNTAWTVVRGQQGTVAATASSGDVVTPTLGDLEGAVIAAVASNAHASKDPSLSNDVTAAILENVQVPGTPNSLLTVLMDPSLNYATGTIIIGGSPALGDKLQVVLTNGTGQTVNVQYTLAGADVGNINQTASDFACAINNSPAVAGNNAFLAPCRASGPAITLTPLMAGMPGSSITSTNTAIAAAAGADCVSISPDSTKTIGQPDFVSQFLAIQLFNKVGVIVRKLHLVAADLNWLLSNASNYGGLDLTSLPVTTAQIGSSLDSLLTTLLLVKQARMFTAAPPSSPVQTLYDIIEGANARTFTKEADIQQALATITGWSLPDIQAFTGIQALSLSYPADPTRHTDYTDPSTYDLLRALEAMCGAVSGVGPASSNIRTFLKADISATDTSITVASNAGFPPPKFYVYLGSEIVLVTSVSGQDNTIWTVERGQQGTVAAKSSGGAPLSIAAEVTAGGDVVFLTFGPQLVNWGSRMPPDEISAENLAAGALSTMKAQQSNESAWLALALTFMDPIRERRSAALRAYLISQSPKDTNGDLIYGDEDGLFNYFLIDTQMSSCQVTSRVVQAYLAVQIFVERCLMNMEPEITVDLNQDETWNQWRKWMSRYRIWEANREVFLYPENWLVESQRATQTEIYKKFEHEVHQGQSTSDYLETVVLNYIDRLDGIAHLVVTGTCESNGAIYVVARTPEDPPVFYLRSYENGFWSGWAQIPLDIKAHQVVPALYRGRVCLFWPEIKLSNEPQQNLPSASYLSGGGDPNQHPDRYATIGLYFSTFRNGSWAPVQTSKVKLFDKIDYDPNLAQDSKKAETLYTLKVSSSTDTSGSTNLNVDLFRYYYYYYNFETIGVENAAVHVGRAFFDGRFGDFELNDTIPFPSSDLDTAQESLYSWAKANYGPEAEPLLPLDSPESDLKPEPFMVPKDGALVAMPFKSFLVNSPYPYVSVTSLTFTSSGLEQNTGTLLWQAQLPFRVIGPDADLSPGFDPTSYFFFQDNRRCYYVESLKYYWNGTSFTPVTPSNPASVPFEMRYHFHVFYHPFTRLFWNQLAEGGFDLLYDPTQRPPYRAISLQENPDQVDSNGADVFSFGNNYQPSNSVSWDLDDITDQDRQFLDYRNDAAYSIYNWELFYHIPIYIAQMLSQNMQFDDARRWFEYLFNPTRQSTDPTPQRFWIPKPFYNISSTTVLQERINEILQQVNYGDTNAVFQVNRWRDDPFDPFLLADLRLGVPYMKYTVMSYIDNLIAWGDNLFTTQSREALNEATLLYETASEILGPTPTALMPPSHCDESFDQLEPSLDAFANAMVNIENTIGATDSSDNGSTNSTGANIPPPQTFYFKIPPNKKLLDYWGKVDDRLYKLRHCQTITGSPLQLALFDAPIDPGLLIQAQAAGVDLTSVLSDITVALPNYRFASLYPIALDFVNAVRGYGTSLQAALEKKDAGALMLLQQTLQQQLLSDGSQILDWQVQQAQSNYDATNQALLLQQQKFDFYSSQLFANPAEVAGTEMRTASGLLRTASAAASALGAGLAFIPDFLLGVAGVGGTPTVTATEGGSNFSKGATAMADVLNAMSDFVSIGADLASTLGSWQRRQDNWTESAVEANIQIRQATDQLNAAQLAIQIAQQNQALHQEQIDNLQKQIDFLNNKFTSDSLYDWMINSLSATYFQSYQLAYQMCKQVEHCYQFELGIPDSSFVNFGYWDSLYTGLLAGETLNHDLRRMQASYLQQNTRHYEITKNISLVTLDPLAFITLKEAGYCFVNIPEELFDMDYPGHFKRRIRSVSLTIPCMVGPYTSINCTLTLLNSRIRVNNTGSDNYPEQNNDDRFAYDNSSSQSIATSTAQNDSGMFELNFHDERYLPFEGRGAISEWLIELPPECNAIDMETVSDVTIKMNYTARDGGQKLRDAGFTNAILPPFQDQSQYNVPKMPPPPAQKTLYRLFSVKHEFANAWYSFMNPPDSQKDQTLSLLLSKDRFPFQFRNMDIKISEADLFLIFKNKSADTAAYGTTSLKITVKPPVGGAVPIILTSKANTYNGVPYGSNALDGSSNNANPWTISIADADIGSLPASLYNQLPNKNYRLNSDEIDNILVVCYYSTS